MAILVTAIATLVYGLATLLLWHETRQDRKLRQKQYSDELAARKLSELHAAFYDAWGHFNGLNARSAKSVVDSSYSAGVFEALIRLEGLLRLNGQYNEANNLGLALRTWDHIDKRLSEVGILLGLTVPEYPIPADIRPAARNPS